MKVEQVAIEKVKPYWQNPRKRSAASIVVDKDYVVIIGHGRLEAAKLLEQKRVPVLIAASLSPGKVKALRIADNRVNRESDWDVKALMAEIDGLKNLDVDVSLAGFDDEDLKRLADDIDEQSLAAIGGNDAEDKPFTDGEEDEGGEGEGDGDEAEPKREAASSGTADDSEDALVNFSEVLSLRQRSVINAAIKVEMARNRLERRGDALFSICERHLEEYGA
jgi:hypothetical protein